MSTDAEIKDWAREEIQADREAGISPDPDRIAEETAGHFDLEEMPEWLYEFCNECLDDLQMREMW